METSPSKKIQDIAAMLDALTVDLGYIDVKPTDPGSVRLLALVESLQLSFAAYHNSNPNYLDNRDSRYHIDGSEIDYWVKRGKNDFDFGLLNELGLID